MGSPTYAQFALLNQDPISKGLGLSFSNQDFLTRSIPVRRIAGKAVIHDRQVENPNTLVSALDIGGTPIATPGTVTQVTHKIGRLYAEVEIDEFEIETSGETNDVLGVQVDTKLRGLHNLWSTQVITGSGTWPNMTGLQNLVDSGQLYELSTTTTGSAISFAILDEILNLVDMPGSLDNIEAGEFEGMPFLAVPKAFRPSINALYRALGAAGPETIMAGFTNPATGQIEPRNVPAYNGVPLYYTAALSTETTYAGSGKYRVYGGVMGGEQGLTGIIPQSGRFLKRGDLAHKAGSANQVMPVSLMTGLTLKSPKLLAVGANLVK